MNNQVFPQLVRLDVEGRLHFRDHFESLRSEGILKVAKSSKVHTLATTGRSKCSKAGVPYRHRDSRNCCAMLFDADGVPQPRAPKFVSCAISYRKDILTRLRAMNAIISMGW